MENLKQHFISCCLIPKLKRQNVYLSPKDTEVAFDESKHIYLLPDKSKRFKISVTGYCKTVVHGTEFDAPQIIRNMHVDEDMENGLDMHVAKLVEWKYSSVFGSLFHAVVEYFFNQIVNACSHKECKQQEFNDVAYMDWLIEETNNFNAKLGILSQCAYPHNRFDTKPILPCRRAIENFNLFVDTILEKETFEQFLKNHYRFNINNEHYIKEIVDTMERAFEVDKSPLKSNVCQYRQTFKDCIHEDAVDKVIAQYYTIDRYINDLRMHLKSFRNILVHLPLNTCCDIRPEYIAFDEEHGLAGSVDLTMRDRYNPYHLFVYDWKTCKKIFNSFRRNQKQTNQLMDYSCQLHTYANLMRTVNPKFSIDLFIVNVTTDDSCIYNVKNFEECSLCFDNFKYFNISMDEIKDC